jgi:hypothetical protein
MSLLLSEIEMETFLSALVFLSQTKLTQRVLLYAAPNKVACAQCPDVNFFELVLRRPKKQTQSLFGANVTSNQTQ